MSQDPFWRNVKAGAAVHTGDIQGRAPPNEGVTEGVERFKSEAAESMGGPGADFGKTRSRNLELLVVVSLFFSPSLSSLGRIERLLYELVIPPTPPPKKYIYVSFFYFIFLSATLMAQSA